MSPEHSRALFIARKDYLRLVGSTLNKLIQEQQPELIIYDAGVDVFAGDPLGLLSISDSALRAREEIVLASCKQASIPVATVIGGGYDDDRLALANRHSYVIEAAFSTYV